MNKKIIFKICIILFVIAVDLITKFAFSGMSFTLIPGLIGVCYNSRLNEGVAGGLFSGYTPIIIVVSLVMIVFLILFDAKYKPDSKLYNLGLCFVVGGAIGNLIDRIVLGGVRDFIVFEFWRDFPTFNVADSFIVVGVVLLAIYILFFNKEDKKEKK